MVRRMIAEAFDELTRPPGGAMPPFPRPRGESLRGAGERMQRRPDSAGEAREARDHARRPRPEPARDHARRPRPEPARDDARRPRPEPAREPQRAPEPKLGVRPDLAASLREPGALRRAVVLMEVLGPPVSLRER